MQPIKAWGGHLQISIGKNNIADLQEFLPEDNSEAERNCEVEWDQNNVVATQLEGTLICPLGLLKTYVTPLEEFSKLIEAYGEVCYFDSRYNFDKNILLHM